MISLLGACLLWFVFVFCVVAFVVFVFALCFCVSVFVFLCLLWVCFVFGACVCFVFARCVFCVCVFVFARYESMRFPQFPHCVQQVCLWLCLLVSLLKIESSVLWLCFCVCSPLRCYCILGFFGVLCYSKMGYALCRRPLAIQIVDFLAQILLFSVPK